MLHKGNIQINKPIDVVSSYFANPDYLGEYQDTFIKKIEISGTPGAIGSISKMYYKHGKQDIELTETIVKNDLPHYFEAHYHHIHMDNTMKCEFTAINEHTTNYAYEYEYTRINWFMPRLISFLFPSMYRKPAEKWLNQFKEFVEKQ